MVEFGNLPEWVSAVSTFGTLAVAGVAAKAAFKQVREARTLREEQARPFVVVDFEPSEAASNLFNIAIENVGLTLATNVKLTFSPELESTFDNDQLVGPQKLSEKRLLSETIYSIPPGKRYLVPFDDLVQRYNENLPRRYDVFVDLCDSKGRPEDTAHYVLDLDNYYGHETVSVHGVHHIAKSLRAWAKKDGVRTF